MLEEAPWQSAQLCRQKQQGIPQQSSACGITHVKEPHSVPSQSASSTSSDNIKLNQLRRQCEVSCKLLSSTIIEKLVLCPRDAVRSIFHGMPFDLSSFEKLRDKSALLDEALGLEDGNTICAVLLFLQKSLDKSVLFTLLKKRPTAAYEYLAILEKQKAFKEASMLCVELQQPEEAAIYLYNNCLRESERNIQSALEMLEVEFKKLLNIDFMTEMLKEHNQLLKIQLAIASNSKNIRAQPGRTKTSPLIGEPVALVSLIGSSLLSTLQYCCRFNWDTPENLTYSRTGI